MFDTLLYIYIYKLYKLSKLNKNIAFFNITIATSMSLSITFPFFVLTQKQLSENVFIDERRPVLLCDGKLCLRALQDLFNLTIVEMMYGMFTKLDLASVGQQ